MAQECPRTFRWHPMRTPQPLQFLCLLYKLQGGPPIKQSVFFRAPRRNLYCPGTAKRLMIWGWGVVEVHFHIFLHILFMFYTYFCDFDDVKLIADKRGAPEVSPTQHPTNSLSTNTRNVYKDRTNIQQWRDNFSKIWKFQKIMFQPFKKWSY